MYLYSIYKEVSLYLKMHELRKKLIRDKKFYPFNDYFEKEVVLNYLQDFIKKGNSNDTDLKLIDTALVATLIYSSFDDTFNYLKKNIFESNLSVDELTINCLSFVNRQLLILNKVIEDKYHKESEHHYEDLFKTKIHSIDPSIGKLDAQSAIESNIDALHILLNYANYFQNKLPPKNPANEEIQSIEAIKRLNIVSAFFYILKTEYDDCIWNNGFASFDEDNKILKFRSFNPDNLILKRIGFHRLQRNSFGFYLVAKEHLEKNDQLAILIKQSFRKNKKHKRIKKIQIQNGCITYKLADGIDKQELNWEVKNSSEFLSYYNFIQDVNLPKLNNLSLNDILNLFDTLQHLFRKVDEFKIDNDEVYKLKDFHKFPFKIKRKDVKNYLLSRTTYSLKQINQFLELLSNKSGKRINFWDYPFIIIGDSYYFPLISIMYPITLVLTDRWLEDGGFSIDARGKYLEKHIKRTIKDELSIKNYEFTIPEESIFKISNEIFEEIDLIVNLKHACIIAEVKCIKFPMEPRDDHNAFNRLQDGAKQIKRKTKFLLQYKSRFEDKIGKIDGKEIVNLVITNYPTFAGYNFEEIPIVDFFLLDAYINSGKIVNKRKTTLGNKTIKDETISEIVFYNNENEFCWNLKDHMTQPPAIEMLKDLFQIQMNKISLSDMNYEIYVESADYKE